MTMRQYDGFSYASNLIKRVSLLKDGKKLLMKHIAFGDHTFEMNPQRNVIICCPYGHQRALPDYTSSSDCILFGFGDWYEVDEVEEEVTETITKIVKKLVEREL